MAANTAVWHGWSPRTLTDSRDDITTVRSHSSAAGLTRQEVVEQQPGTIDLVITESGQIMRRIQFSIPSTPVPTWLARTIERGGKLLALPFDWDRQGAQSIEPMAIQAALDTLYLFMNEHSPLPEWSPTREGGVQLDWHEKGIDLEIEFAPSASDGYAVFEDQQGQLPEWDGRVTANLDSLRRIFDERLR